MTNEKKYFGLKHSKVYHEAKAPITAYDEPSLIWSICSEWAFSFRSVETYSDDVKAFRGKYLCKACAKMSERKKGA